MVLQILAFGIAKDIFGARQINFVVPSQCTVETMKDLLEERFPALKRLATYAVAINEVYAVPAQYLQEKDEVAIIPPVSGG